MRSGSAYDDVIGSAKEPLVRTRISVNDNDPDAGNTFEVQLGDGRWLHINERRTKDGGFVSVGTDITPLFIDLDGNASPPYRQLHGDRGGHDATDTNAAGGYHG